MTIMITMTSMMRMMMTLCCRMDCPLVTPLILTRRKVIQVLLPSQCRDRPTSPSQRRATRTLTSSPTSSPWRPWDCPLPLLLLRPPHTARQETWPPPSRISRERCSPAEPCSPARTCRPPASLTTSLAGRTPGCPEPGTSPLLLLSLHSRHPHHHHPRPAPHLLLRRRWSWSRSLTPTWRRSGSPRRRS